MQANTLPTITKVIIFVFPLVLLNLFLLLTTVSKATIATTSTFATKA